MPRLRVTGPPQSDGSGEDFNFNELGDPTDDEGQPETNMLPQMRVRRHASIETAAGSSNLPTQPASPAAATISDTGVSIPQTTASGTGSRSRTAALDILHFFDKGDKTANTRTYCKICKYVCLLTIIII
jgi:hypothetical protein